MSYIRILKCSSNFWYAGLIGATLPLLTQDEDGYWVREQSGFLNVILFDDAEIVGDSLSEEQLRSAFELVAVNGETCLLPLGRKPNGDYFYAKQQTAWEFFKAGHQAKLAGDIPKRTSMYNAPYGARIGRAGA